MVLIHEKVKEQLCIRKKISESPYCSPGFMINEEGVFYAPVDEEGEYKTRLKICSRLDIVARTRDENGLSHGRLLEFHDPDGAKHQWALPMEMLAGMVLNIGVSY